MSSRENQLGKHEIRINIIGFLWLQRSKYLLLILLFVYYSFSATCVFQNYISLPADVKDPEAIELTSDFLKSLLVTNKTSFSLTRCLSNNEIIEKEPDLFIDASNHDDVQRKVRIKLAGMKCGDEEIPMAPDLEQIFRSKGGTYYPVRFQCDKSILR